MEDQDLFSAQGGGLPSAEDVVAPPWQEARSYWGEDGPPQDVARTVEEVAPNKNNSKAEQERLVSNPGKSSLQAPLQRDRSSPEEDRRSLVDNRSSATKGGASKNKGQRSVLLSEEDRTRSATSDLQWTLTASERGAWSPPPLLDERGAAFGDQYCGRTTWSVVQHSNSAEQERLVSAAEEEHSEQEALLDSAAEEEHSEQEALLDSAAEEEHSEQEALRSRVAALGAGGGSLDSVAEEQHSEQEHFGAAASGDVSFQHLLEEAPSPAGHPPEMIHPWKGPSLTMLDRGMIHPWKDPSLEKIPPPRLVGKIHVSRDPRLSTETSRLPWEAVPTHVVEHDYPPTSERPPSHPWSEPASNYFPKSHPWSAEPAPCNLPASHPWSDAPPSLERGSPLLPKDDPPAAILRKGRSFNRPLGGGQGDEVIHSPAAAGEEVMGDLRRRARSRDLFDYAEQAAKAVGGKVFVGI